MKYPHYLESFFEKWELKAIGNNTDGEWWLRYCKCPACHQLICFLRGEEIVRNAPPMPPSKRTVTYLIRSKGIARAPIPKEVPERYAKDYQEACIVLLVSPKAIALLGDGCMLHSLSAIKSGLPELLNVKLSRRARMPRRPPGTGSPPLAGVE